MDEKELRQYAHECGLLGACVDTLVRRIVYGEKWAVIADKLKYGYSTVYNKHRPLIVKKLGVEKI